MNKGLKRSNSIWKDKIKKKVTKSILLCYRDYKIHLYSDKLLWK